MLLSLSSAVLFSSVLKNLFLDEKKPVTNDLFFFVDVKSNSTLIFSHAVPSVLSLAVLILPTINS